MCFIDGECYEIKVSNTPIYLTSLDFKINGINAPPTHPSS